jgi:hypothetical protein
LSNICGHWAILEHPYLVALCKSLTLPANIKQGWKCLVNTVKIEK